MLAKLLEKLLALFLETEVDTHSRGQAPALLIGTRNELVKASASEQTQNKTARERER